MDFDWVDQFKPVHVVFDAAEENPDYHKRMIDYLTTLPHREQIARKLPDYAKSTAQELLIRILCRGKCSMMRWARLNEPYPGKSALRSSPMGTYTAKCLVCGYEAIDNYNWFR